MNLKKNKKTTEQTSFYIYTLIRTTDIKYLGLQK